ncbi:hypothetical protein M8818_002726 [Zalaria obscura]|uniref:Uncharacterized protein n=1 Tax=Zalaria obscura TaxID=2024903 RepID=A0ACC3SHB6_9PEZI
MFSMFNALPLYIVLSVASYVRGQSCWRDTTCSGPLDTAFPGPWQSNIYSPESRVASPVSILSLANASVISSWPGSAPLQGNASALVFDFGKEVGGIATVNYTASGAGALGLAFTEAKNWIGLWSDSSNGKFEYGDGAIYSNFSQAGDYTYTMDLPRLRGGFRYLTLFLITNDTVTNLNITAISLEIGFQPTWSNLQAYQGYFDSNDEELNKIWYSGAYTLQTNAVPVDTGRWIPALASGWANNGTLGPGDTIIVDGAKRDRAVWPGDMGVAVPSTFVSIGDLTSVKNALQVMYDNQNADGSFPEAGPPLLQQGSDTYHMWTMIGTYNYLLFTNDTAFLEQNWNGYLRAMEARSSKAISLTDPSRTGTVAAMTTTPAISRTHMAGPADRRRRSRTISSDSWSRAGRAYPGPPTPPNALPARNPSCPAPLHNPSSLRKNAYDSAA